MPILIPDQLFGDGDDFTPKLFDLVAHPVFTNDPSLAGQYIGYRPALRDENLSDDATQLKPRFEKFESSLSVIQGSNPLTVRVLAGGVRLLNGNVGTIASQQYNVPDNTVSYVFLDQTGTVQVDATPTPVRRILAKVIASGGEIIIEDWNAVFYRDILPRVDTIQIFGGNGEEGDYNVAAGETKTLAENTIYNFRNVTVAAGGTLIVDKYCTIRCSGNFTNNGTISITPATSGGPVYCLALTNTRVVGGSGFGIGGGGGSSTYSGKPYSYAMQKFGSGGGTGVLEGTAGGGCISGGGFGGGGLVVEAAGDILNTGTITAIGSDAIPGSFNASPPPTGHCSGAGGGSGGLVYLASIKSVVSSLTSTINVRGGAGSNGVVVGTYGNAAGGGGGAGGQVVCVSPAINLTGATINLNGGAGGNSSGPDPYTGGGIGGGFGGQGGASGGVGSAGDLIIRLNTPQQL